MKSIWPLKSLHEVCLIRPPKSEIRSVLAEADLVTFAPMDKLGTDQMYFTSLEQRPLGSVINNYTYFKENDVILAKITPCFENGKLGIAKNLKNKVGFGSSEFVVYRPSKELLSEYLYYFLYQPSFRDEGSAKMVGAVGHKRIPKEFYERSFIPLPPLPIQKQIVQILDEAFAAIDKAKDNIQKNIQNAEELSQAKQFDIFSNRKWTNVYLNEIADNLDSKRIPITKNKRKKGLIPYYGASGIVDYVDNYIFDEDLLLISEDGANLLARTYPIAFSIKGKSWVNNHAHVLRFKDFITQKFVEIYLNSIPLDHYISGMAQPKLNQAKLNSIMIPLPDITLQRTIVNNLLRIKESLNQLKDFYKAKLNLLDELKKSLLQKAFSGELTKEADIDEHLKKVL